MRKARDVFLTYFSKSFKSFVKFIKVEKSVKSIHSVKFAKSSFLEFVMDGEASCAY